LKSKLIRDRDCKRQIDGSGGASPGLGRTGAVP
jgi:hypothetical protein